MIGDLSMGRLFCFRVIATSDGSHQHRYNRLSAWRYNMIELIRLDADTIKIALDGNGVGWITKKQEWTGETKYYSSGFKEVRKTIGYEVRFEIGYPYRDHFKGDTVYFSKGFAVGGKKGLGGNGSSFSMKNGLQLNKGWDNPQPVETHCETSRKALAKAKKWAMDALEIVADQYGL